MALIQFYVNWKKLFRTDAFRFTSYILVGAIIMWTGLIIIVLQQNYYPKLWYIGILAEWMIPIGIIYVLVKATSLLMEVWKR